MSEAETIIPGILLMVKAGFRFKGHVLFVDDSIMVIEHFESHNTIYNCKIYYQTILLPNGEVGSFELDERSFWHVFEACSF